MTHKPTLRKRIHDWFHPPKPSHDETAREDAALIVYAVNRLPDYEAAVDVLSDAIAEDGFSIELKDDARAVLARLRDAASIDR